VGSALTAWKKSGERHPAAIPQGPFRDGQVIAWRVRAFDGTAYGPWSPFCEPGVDLTVPDQTPSVSSADYPEAGTGEPGGGVGRAGSFTFAPSGVPDVVGYVYSDTEQPRDRGRRPVPAAGTAQRVEPSGRRLRHQRATASALCQRCARRYLSRQRHVERDRRHPQPPACTVARVGNLDVAVVSAGGTALGSPLGRQNGQGRSRRRR
jgi:hypothetical protein